MNRYFQTIGNAVTGKVGRWVVLLFWILAVLLLSLTLPNVNDRTQNNSSTLPDNADSVLASKLLKKEFPHSTGLPALITWHRESGLTERDLSNIQHVSKTFNNNPLQEQTFTPPFDKMPIPVLKNSVSKDGTTFVQPIIFTEEAEIDLLKKNIAMIEQTIIKREKENPFTTNINSNNLSVRITGPAGISVDTTELFKGADFKLLLATVLLVLVVLLLIYRAPLLAIIPLIGVGFAYLVTSPILGFMADRDWITVDSQAISIMTVLLFGAGTDYCLFLISYYRNELKKHENKRKALVAAFKDSSGAIAMSGLTVVISLLALLIATYGSYQRFAVPFSLSILVMMIAAITLIPALLSIFGRTSFYPFVPKTPEMEERHAKKKGRPVIIRKEKGTIGKWVAHIVTDKPWSIIVSSLIIFVALASFSLKINYSYDLLSSFPKDMNSREGYDVISNAYSPGDLAPTTIVVDTDGKDIDLSQKLKKLQIIKSISKPIISVSNPNLQSYELKFAVNPYDLKAIEFIPQLRSLVEKEIKAHGILNSEKKVWISGQTAMEYDKKETVETDEWTIIPIVILFISFLLLVYLRSVTAMIYLMGTVILSFFAAMGLGWIILHYAMDVQSIERTIPLYSFVFLIALGEDYNIFMISNIWYKKATMPFKQAIQEGVSETSSVITSAGIILAATFAVLTTLPIQVLVQFGLITAIGVLMDTFIVRPFLVPSITSVLGKYAQWPSKANYYKEKKESF